MHTIETHDCPNPESFSLFEPQPFLAGAKKLQIKGKESRWPTGPRKLQPLTRSNRTGNREPASLHAAPGALSRKEPGTEHGPKIIAEQGSSTPNHE